MVSDAIFAGQLPVAKPGNSEFLVAPNAQLLGNFTKLTQRAVG